MILLIMIIIIVSKMLLSQRESWAIFRLANVCPWMSDPNTRILHQNCLSDGQLAFELSSPQHHALSDHFSNFTKFNNFTFISTKGHVFQLYEGESSLNSLVFILDTVLTEINIWLPYKAPKANGTRSGKYWLFHFMWMCFVSEQTRIITEADWVIFFVIVFPSVAKNKAHNSFHVHSNINKQHYLLNGASRVPTKHSV